jgi:hypothetical protein
MALYWMSFCDPAKPKGEQFMGVALVEAETEAGMMTQSWLTGCNPGGEIQFVEIPVEDLPNDRRVLLAKAPRHTLMSKADLEHFGLLD